MLCKAAAIVSHLASGIAHFEENAHSAAELTTIRTDLQLQAAVCLFPWSQSFARFVSVETMRRTIGRNIQRMEL